MAQRGRPNSLTLVGPSGLECVERPSAPDELTAEQAAEWRAIVGRMPADWFPRESWPLLVQLCRHVCTARYIDAHINTMQNDPGGFDPAAFERWVKLQAIESARIAALSTKLRLSQQSNTSFENAKTKKPTLTQTPWKR